MRAWGSCLLVAAWSTAARTAVSYQPESHQVPIDSVRERFGSKAITRGVLVGRGEAIEMPLLPD